MSLDRLGAGPLVSFMEAACQFGFNVGGPDYGEPARATRAKAKHVKHLLELDGRAQKRVRSNCRKKFVTSWVRYRDRGRKHFTDAFGLQEARSGTQLRH